MSLNLADLYEGISDLIPDRTALVCDGRRRTYVELDEGSNRIARHLASVGVGPGDHVALHMRNSVEFVESLLGCLKIRAVPINVNYRYVDAELTYLYNDSQSVALIVDEEFVSVVETVLPAAPGIKHVVVVGESAVRDIEGVDVVRFADAAAEQPATRDFAPRSNDDLFVIYTGGTTGMPKGVMWRHEDFYFAALTGGNPFGPPHTTAQALFAAVPNVPAMNMLSTAPLMHGAASYSLFTGFFMGANAILMARFDAKTTLQLAGSEKAVSITVVGDAMARPLADELAANAADYDLGTVGMVSSGGALFSLSLREQLKSILPNLVIRDGFGSSESGVDGNLEIGEDGLMRIAARDETRVVDERMRPLEPGSPETGYIARSGHVPVGYFNDPVKTAATFPVIDGVRMSVLGDVGRVEADGSIVLLGRGSQCINTGGEKVYPEEVEQALKSHPAVLDALVAGIPDAKFGERVAAVITTREGFDVPDAAEIGEHCASQVARYKVPRTVMNVPSIRRSPSGKADYRWAKATLAEQVS
ncbi:acyl-CoA synthetase [Rhodococcus sp. H-CA8f]|uniref:acyl-CoA synthetase n=1 Tax=Rhodococcus TaxID=1827 RepID=UPI000BE49317|nr:MULTISPECIES: acyl-CoA synthetase [Rhodococcus]ATI31374.1 acyl-CoA synthetase [Rhodococcus sp. H-CA8f]MBY6382682.1 acyl-CoA synthetase [Rhodococcus erythropolis]MCZ4565093.1 acyl-CoA synthetase [Rhodococcus erythropolis]